MEPQIQSPLSKKERRKLKRQESQAEWETVIKKRRLKKIVSWILSGAIAIALIGTVARLVPTRPNLPPTDIQGHIEESPNAHVTNTPMPATIQRHMLEHADGKGKPGIIIQYNCDRYSCEPDLVDRLTNLVKQHPDNVYLAPSNYDGEIILTKMNKIQVLQNFDEQAIKSFIE